MGAIHLSCFRVTEAHLLGGFASASQKCICSVVLLPRQKRICLRFLTKQITRHGGTLNLFEHMFSSRACYSF